MENRINNIAWNKPTRPVIVMLGNNDPNRNKLKTILAAKSHEVIERFRQTAISGITDTDVISILEAVQHLLERSIPDPH